MLKYYLYQIMLSCEVKNIKRNGNNQNEFFFFKYCYNDTNVVTAQNASKDLFDQCMYQ